MMRQMIMSIVFVAVVAQFAEARIGETYAQCAARYGSSYTNFPGLDHLYGVAVFEKDGINVTVAYDRPNKQGFLALYTNGRFLSQKERSKAGDLKDNEVDSLMATLNVSWESAVYNPPKSTTSPQSQIDPSMRTFAGPRNVKGGTTLGTSSPAIRKDSSPPKPKWTENLTLAKDSVKAFIEAITLERRQYPNGPTHFMKMKVEASSGFGSRIIDQYALIPYRRCGDHLFAFKLVADDTCYGLILVNSDVSKAISEWAKAYLKSHDKPPSKDMGRKLEGF